MGTPPGAGKGLSQNNQQPMSSMVMTSQSFLRGRDNLIDLMSCLFNLVLCSISNMRSSANFWVEHHL